jgi:hypothetical protein
MLVIVDNQDPQSGFHKASAIGGGLGSIFDCNKASALSGGLCGGLHACWFAYLVCANCAEKITTLHTDLLLFAQHGICCLPVRLISDRVCTTESFVDIPDRSRELPVCALLQVSIFHFDRLPLHGRQHG